MGDGTSGHGILQAQFHRVNITRTSIVLSQTLNCIAVVFCQVNRSTAKHTPEPKCLPLHRFCWLAVQHSTLSSSVKTCPGFTTCGNATLLVWAYCPSKLQSSALNDQASYHVSELAINSLLGKSPGQGAMYVSFFLWMSTSVTWMNPATLLEIISSGSLA